MLDGCDELAPVDTVDGKIEQDRAEQDSGGASISPVRPEPQRGSDEVDVGAVTEVDRRALRRVVAR